jgi:hypothetical protein
MSDAVEVAIEAALLAHAQAFATANSLTIAMPNLPFTPPTSTQTAKWLRTSFFPAPTDTLAVANGTNRHYGLLQIDCFYGQGAGELAPGRIAAAAIAYFKRGTTLTRDGFTIRILKAPSRRPHIKDDPWIFVPVRIEYVAFASNPA